MMTILVWLMTILYMLYRMMSLWRTRAICTIDERLALGCHSRLRFLVRNLGGDIIKLRESWSNCPGCSNPRFALYSGPKKLFENQLRVCFPVALEFRSPVFNNRLFAIIHGDDVAGISRVGQHLTMICSMHVVCVSEAGYYAAPTSIVAIFDGHCFVLEILLFEMLQRMRLVLQPHMSGVMGASYIVDSIH